MRHVSSLLAFAVAIATSCLATNAHAVKDLKRFGLQAGFAGVAGSEGSFSGYGGALSFEYGLSDAWSLASNVTATSNQVASKGGRSLVLSQAVGFQYALDVIQVTPYLGLYGAVYELQGGGLDKRQVKAGGQFAIGVDYLYERAWTFGIEFRGHILPADFAKAFDNPTPFYITTMLKAEYTWGW